MIPQTHTADDNELTAHILRKAADDLENGADGGPTAGPVMTAVEKGSISAGDATRLRDTAQRMGMDVAPIIDAIAENDTDVEAAIDLMEAVGGDTSRDVAEDDEKDDPGELKADMDGVSEDVEQKATTTRTLGELISDDTPSDDVERKANTGSTLGDIVRRVTGTGGA